MRAALTPIRVADDAFPAAVARWARVSSLGTSTSTGVTGGKLASNVWTRPSRPYAMIGSRGPICTATRIAVSPRHDDRCGQVRDPHAHQQREVHACEKPRLRSSDDSVPRLAPYTLPMLAAAPSAAVLGIDALDMLVEVQVANGLPQWTSVGTKPPCFRIHGR